MFLRYDFDPAIWIGMPHFDKFDPWQDPQAWAEELSRDLWSESGAKHRRSDLARLTELLHHFAKCRLDDDTPDVEHFLHIPQPWMIPHPIRVWMANIPGCTLRDWVIADDPEAVEPPIVEPFHAAGLGDGLRAYRCRVDSDADPNTRPGALYAVLRYAWPLVSEETAVVLAAAHPDPAHLLKMIPDIDEFAQRIHLVDREGQQVDPDLLSPEFPE